MSLEIIEAEYSGFCSGVKKAVENALAAARDGPVFALGPLAHNEALQRQLEQNGITTVESLAQIPSGGTLLIRTHGAAPSVFDEAALKGLKVIDATCPHVKKLQKLIARLAKSGKHVVIAGDPAHPEVKALVAWGQSRPKVISSADRLKGHDFKGDLALVSQTTQRKGITDEIGEKLNQLNLSVEIYNTICLATSRRQEAASRLAAQVDLMVVVGGSQSSNTAKLAETCRASGVRTIMVTEAADLDKKELHKAARVGITAGASTPDWTIKEVIAKMENEDKTMQEEQDEKEQAAEEQPAKEKVAEEQQAEEQAAEEQPVKAEVAEEQQAEEQVAEEQPVKAEEEQPEEQTAEEQPVKAEEEQPEEQAAEEQPVKAEEEQPEKQAAGETDIEEQELPEDVRELSVGDVVTGVVVQVDEGEALVDIGYKSEGILPRQEVIVDDSQSLSDAVQVGQELELVVKKINMQEDKILLSRRILEKKGKWQELETAFEEGKVLTGRVKEAVPAGMVVDLGAGFEGFMPGSLVDLRFIPDFSEFLNQEVNFKIIELRREKEKVVLSRKQVLEEEAAGKKEETLASLKTGQVINGTVKRLTNFGAFVDVGGIDGLIHISEISWHRIEHPSEVLSVGEEVEVKVIELIPERERIGLSLRQAQPDPWTEVARKFKAGEIVEGKVTRLVSFGAFVELIPGVEGLVHISQMANYHVKQASEVVEEGQIIKVKILDINTEAKRVSLSIREASPRPKKEAVSTQEPADTGGLTLGDVFGNLFDNKDE